MPKQFIAELKDRDTIDSPFMVKEKTLAVAKNGKPYMNLKFMDKSGEVDGKLWEHVDELDKVFKRGDFVHIRGTASLYMGKLQVVAREIRPLPEEAVDLSDFMPVSPVPLDQMLAELQQVTGSLTDPHLSALMQLFITDTQFMSGYCKAPAAKGMHHVYLGGLLEHSLSVVRLVDAVVSLYPDLNRDLLVTGALLHDLGKVAELSYDRAFEYTDEGRLIGHISIGMEMLQERIGQVAGFPRDLAMLLKHMLLSHHGQYEYGLPPTAQKPLRQPFCTIWMTWIRKSTASAPTSVKRPPREAVGPAITACIISIFWRERTENRPGRRWCKNPGSCGNGKAGTGTTRSG